MLEENDDCEENNDVEEENYDFEENYYLDENNDIEENYDVEENDNLEENNQILEEKLENDAIDFTITSYVQEDIHKDEKPPLMVGITTDGASVLLGI